MPMQLRPSGPPTLAVSLGLAFALSSCLSSFDPDGVNLTANEDTTVQTDGEGDVGADSDAGNEDADRRDTGLDSEEPDLADTDVEGCVDGDGDGAAGTGRDCNPLAEDFDCDDRRVDVHPGAVEVCDGADNDCDGATDEAVSNGCGGCDELDRAPGQLCGDCGQVLCDGINATRCGEGLGSACGGCQELAGVPGQHCGECGTYACTGINSVECRDSGFDACGGCGDSSRVVGSTCGACLDGVWACSATDFVCQGSTAPRLYYRDSDGDGFGVDGESAVLCAPDAPYTAAEGGDCDDGNSLRFPGNAEVCDTRDNDCNGSIDDGVLNGCDGCTALSGVPGNPCGTCGQGIWECRGPEAVQCVGIGVNSCGGCDALPEMPGDPCGACGTVVCDGADATRCVDPGANACGGCGTLPTPVGAACGACGTSECDNADNNNVVCNDPGANVCNGCQPITATLGAPCGTCGTVACDGLNTTRCSDPGANLCGGCGTLPAIPSTPCGECGTFGCDGNNSDNVLCTDPGHNSCGGCVTLTIEPGTSCGDCGNYVCAPGNNSVECDGDNLNICGGCLTLTNPPGTSCGDCGNYVCDQPDTTICSDTGLNSCGGCTQLAHPPGTGCGACGNYACSDIDATACNDPGTNLCNGCSTLPHALGEACGSCGSWACFGDDDVQCADPGFNACNGCGPLTEVLGSACGSCGVWQCDPALPGSVTCVDPGFATFYRDQDRDTFGNPTDSIAACQPANFYDTTNNTDCDDTTAAVNPSIVFDGCDGLNNDCDTQIDEDWFTDCDDGLECNGQETCGGSACIPGTSINDPYWTAFDPRPAFAMGANARAAGALAMAPTGEYVMTVCENDEVVAMIFDSFGNPSSPTFVASPNQHRVDKDGWAPVAMDGNGNLAIAWVDDLGRDIYFRRFDAGGTPLNDPVLVSQGTTAEEPGAIAMSPAGNVVVAWNTRADNGQVYMRLYNSANAPMIPEVLVPSPNGSSDSPAVAMDEVGAFAVVWTGNDRHVDGHRFDERAVSLGPFSVPGAIDVYDPPSISMAPDGRFAVGYRTRLNQGDAFVATFRRTATQWSETRVNNSGNAVSGPVQPDAPGVAVAMNADGNVLAAWNEESRRTTFSHLDFDGNVTTDSYVIDSTCCNERPPSVAAAQCFDNFVVGWYDKHVLFLADDNHDSIPDQCCAP